MCVTVCVNGGGGKNNCDFAHPSCVIESTQISLRRRLHTDRKMGAFKKCGANFLNLDIFISS